MQCLQLTRGDAPSTAVTVTLSGEFDSTYAYVTIGGTMYTEATTLMVKQGTEVTVGVSGASSSAVAVSITLNGKRIEKALSYTFAVTDNCKIVGKISQGSSWGKTYGTIDITMPA